jgi:hypothetical protein
VESQLRDKHARMRKELFAFLRGTYYRWVELWTDADAELRRAPTILAVGDLHIDSFGTWRDVEGRLNWGVDDFDDAYPLPYTNDLVRLAASVKTATDAGIGSISLGDACAALLESYRETLRAGGAPVVLAERRDHLDKLGIAEFEPPDHFWQHLEALPAARGAVPRGAKRALEATLPGPRLPYRVVRREAGTGSLGQSRYVALAIWDGARVAREAKALVPSANEWLAGRRGRGQPFYARAITSAVRAPDPFHRVVGHWLIRRLSPDSNPIMIADLPAKRDEAMLIHAMGAETANVHLGTARQRTHILADLKRRPADWLRRAAKAMAKSIERDWKEYRGA